MNSVMRVVLAATILATACASAALSQVLVPHARAAAHERWEHFCFRAGLLGDANLGGLNKKLDEAGQQGWELVAIGAFSGEAPGALYCMKRPGP